MPPRWLCLLILVFWAGFNGWLFFDDLLPRLLPHQPPPYTIDLTEEAQLRRPHIEWTVLCDGQKVFRAHTSVAHPGHDNVKQHDVFEMKSEFKPFHEKGKVSISGFEVRKMSSIYRVNAAGDLLGLSVHIEPDVPEVFAALLKSLGAHPDDEVSLDIDGQVISGRLRSEGRLALKSGKGYQRPLPEVPISRGSSVLLPLHPVNRLRGISPGQRWRMAVLDPLKDLSDSLLGGTSRPQFLNARVRPELEDFSHGQRLGTSCMVIDYTGDDFTGSTWVARDRGLVLRQEVTIEGRRWEMNRD
jgi:hypothetical protein